MPKMPKTTAFRHGAFRIFAKHGAVILVMSYATRRLAAQFAWAAWSVVFMLGTQLRGVEELCSNLLT